MSSVPNVSANNGVQAAAQPSKSDVSNMSPFMYLAKAMEDSATAAQKLFDSRSPEEREKQAILQQLQGISDLDEKQAMIKFLMKAFAGSGNKDLVAWLGNINNQIQSIIDQIKKIFSKIIKDDLKTIEKGQKRSKKWYSAFLGDDENDFVSKKLVKQRAQIISNIKELLSGSPSLQNLAQLEDQFSQLASVVSQEQANLNKGTLAPMARWCKKKYNEDKNDHTKETVTGPYGPQETTPSQNAWMFAMGEKIGEFIDGEDFTKTIWKDSTQLVADSSFIVNEAHSANQILVGHDQVDSNKLSALIQKDTSIRNKYDDLMKNTLIDDSSLIAKVNYSNKV